MPASSFKFISPGIFLNEIDNSQIPQPPGAIGPTIIGRSAKGRALSPINVQSFSDFVDLFGSPKPGGSNSEYRSSDYAGPTYGSYAAQAYLNAGVGPVNYIRLLGVPHPEATSTGLAGWTTNQYSSGDPTAQAYATNGGAYGLFIAASQSSGNHLTGTLAAVLYLVAGAVALSGTVSVAPTTTDSGTNRVLQFAGTDSSTEFVVSVFGGTKSAPTNEKKLKFNFNRDSSQFIRNVLNTNPVLTNDGVVASNSLTKNENVYWLGESYETEVANRLTGSFTSVVAWLAPVASGTLSNNINYGYMKFTENNNLYSNSNVIDGRTGWFFSQDFSNDTASFSYNNMPKLFRFHGLDAGEWTQKNIKISIDNIVVSSNQDAEPYAKFSVVVRSINDNDSSPVVLERFDNLNLNPNSPDYIGVRIGDKTRKFDYAQNSIKEYGQYNNVSRYIRVEVNPSVEAGLVNPASVPFGVFGPIKPKDATNISSGSTSFNTYIGFGSYAKVDKSDAIVDVSTNTNFTCSIAFPSTTQKISASEGNIVDTTRAYFGVRTAVDTTSNRFDQSIPDTLRLYSTDSAQNVGLEGLDTAGPFTYQWVFSLDDVILPSNSTAAFYASGSRKTGTSRTATSGGYGGSQSILAVGFNKFTTVFQGGFDGLNIQEAEPFQFNRLDGNTKLNSYEVNTLEVAINMAGNPELLETNMIVAPGVRDENLTRKIIDTCEARGDAMAIIDIRDGYLASTESTQSYKDRLGSTTTAITRLNNRKINSSYACTYYPWVQIRDSINGALVWVPPSVITLGTMASSERASEVWFAPAGFNRGGLTAGAGGLPVVNVAEKLTSKQRDDLYQANINPIASFPSEGIVVFGQKTLQVTPSALDRINVRRLMIYIKKQVSRFATSVLFDQNVTVTWNRFKASVEPFLASVQARLGLTEYRLILDETTTTPDLVDRNVLYAKILLKPARAIEFIAVDFVISRTGASFED
jgi:hypothetical protein